MWASCLTLYVTYLLNFIHCKHTLYAGGKVFLNKLVYNMWSFPLFLHMIALLHAHWHPCIPWERLMAGSWEIGSTLRGILLLHPERLLWGNITTVVWWVDYLRGWQQLDKLTEICSHQLQRLNTDFYTADLYGLQYITKQYTQAIPDQWS